MRVVFIEVPLHVLAHDSTILLVTTTVIPLATQDSKWTKDDRIWAILDDMLTHFFDTHDFPATTWAIATLRLGQLIQEWDRPAGISLAIEYQILTTGWALRDNAIIISTVTTIHLNDRRQAVCAVNMPLVAGQSRFLYGFKADVAFEHAFHCGHRDEFVSKRYSFFETLFYLGSLQRESHNSQEFLT